MATIAHHERLQAPARPAVSVATTAFRRTAVERLLSPTAWTA
jgi:hypothetical protein